MTMILQWFHLSKLIFVYGRETQNSQQAKIHLDIVTTGLSKIQIPAKYNFPWRVLSVNGS